ncbi:MAG: T9SS type A sorting domain-containing protein [Bacteroidota bacterium]
MLKRITGAFLALVLALLFVSWGSSGHYKISFNSSLSFYQQMIQISAWPQYLADHASDADDRKATDPTEAPKHYINIDNYASFNTTGHIPQTWDSIVAQNGSVWVTDMGTLPWTTLATYDSLRHAFQHQNWSAAMFFAADLGHYVADGHMPLHITKNYDGQNTGNDGIHSRYESSMIYGFNSQIVYTGDTVRPIANVNQYVFNYIYKNFTYVDSVLLADDYATGLSTNYNSSTYKNALWAKTRNFTTLMFKNASHALAELIYNAWLQAGSPTEIAEHHAVSTIRFMQNAPNPFAGSTQITFSVEQTPTQISLAILNYQGKTVATLLNQTQAEGTHNLSWTPTNLPSGIYFCKLTCGNTTQVLKMVYMK